MTSINESIFVKTRTLKKDYDYFLIPNGISSMQLDNIMQKAEYTIKNPKKVYTSDWFCRSLGDEEIVFRIVQDGSTDIYCRPIRRYEGAIMKYTLQNIALLENELATLREKTKNYGNGFSALEQANTPLSQQKPQSISPNVLYEDCQVEITDKGITINSDLLYQYLKTYGSIQDLFGNIQIKPNNNQNKRRKF